MARKFLVNIDLNRNELQNARIHNLAAAPSTPGEGRIYYDSGSRAVWYWNSSEWVAVDARFAYDIPLSALATDPLDRANHTGTQPAATISNLATVVKAYPISDFSAATAPLNMGGFTITNVPVPTAPGQVAEYSWVMTQIQASSAGIVTKDPCTVVAVGNVVLSGLQTIDGVTLADGDSVLCVGQTNDADNGPYSVHAGAWVRRVTEDEDSELVAGSFWLIDEGLVYSKSQWRNETVGSVTVGTTPIVIRQFGAAQSYSATDGVKLVGNTFSADYGAGLQVVSGKLTVDTSTVVGKYAETFGDGTANSYTISHNLNTQDVTVSVRQVADNTGVECDWQALTVNTVVLGMVNPVGVNELRVVIHG